MQRRDFVSKLILGSFSITSLVLFNSCEKDDIVDSTARKIRFNNFEHKVNKIFITRNDLKEGYLIQSSNNDHMSSRQIIVGFVFYIDDDKAYSYSSLKKKAIWIGEGIYYFKYKTPIKIVVNKEDHRVNSRVFIEERLLSNYIFEKTQFKSF
ncbi:hypothetical protein [Myroides sp. TSA_177.3]|uniref:hypothetical protein n=1 Tax=Myroides sp. TSA_177.3 TaxID=3415650 RepID=UPI0040464B42